MPLGLQFTSAVLSVVEGTNQDSKPIRVLVVTDPVSGINVQIPLTEEEAWSVAAELTGSKLAVAPASAMPT